MFHSFWLSFNRLPRLEASLLRSENSSTGRERFVLTDHPREPVCRQSKLPSLYVSLQARSNASWTDRRRCPKKVVFADWVRAIRPQLKVEVVRRGDAAEAFAVLPRRWVVERTFGWLMKQRRLVRDYERTETSAAAMIHIAMIRIMLRR